MSAPQPERSDPEITPPPPLDALDGPPRERFCDLVMKGGVVDGIVYPWAIVELARHYRFQKLGGTSVGAMAAALTAAAEYQRRRGSNSGFNEVLRKLPQKLAEPQADGRTRLLHLFQPQTPGLRLFALFVALFSGNPAQATRQLLPEYLPTLVLALLAGLLSAVLAMLGWQPQAMVSLANAAVWAPVLVAALSLLVAAAGMAAIIGAWLVADAAAKPAEASPASSAFATHTTTAKTQPTAAPRAAVRWSLRLPVAWIGGVLLAAAVFALVPCVASWFGSVAGVVSEPRVATSQPTLVQALHWAEGGLAAGVMLLPWLAVSALVLLIALAFQWWPGFRHAVSQNHFGLCRGGSMAEQEHFGVPGLTDWLHEGIQGAAGLELDTPLTFRQLWEAPGGPQAAQPNAPRPRSIELHVVSSALALGRPLGFPLAPGEPRLLFDLDEWQGYFPASVLAFLRRHARPYQPGPDEPGIDPDAPNPPQQLLELPRGDLPVLVAVRLSLSFPVLFSAVPLWATDFRDAKGQRVLRRCHFSDGGLASNFPIHIFDAAVPRWPTFGISLGKRNVRLVPQDSDVAAMPGAKPGAASLARVRNVALSRYHYEGGADSWHVFDQPGVFGRTAGFALAILDTMRCWNDQASLRMPGVRDRVVHIQPDNGVTGVGATSGVGGLNLALPSKTILHMAQQGQQAGLLLVSKFVLSRATQDAWAEHRWVRFQSLVQGLRQHLAGLAESARASTMGGDSINFAIEQALQSAPLQAADGAREQVLSPHQAAAWRRVLADLIRLDGSLAALPGTQPYVPQPQGEYHIRPPV